MENQPIVKSFSVKSSKPGKPIIILIAILVIAGGLGTGYLLTGKSSGIAGIGGATELKRNVSQEEIKAGLMVGVVDEKSFKDSAEGELEKGGIDGEGSHHLVRPGGESQSVYLTSSIIDLDKFSGHKVKVWGETFSAQKAGWLMDVGKLKVLE